MFLMIQINRHSCLGGIIFIQKADLIMTRLRLNLKITTQGLKETVQSNINIDYVDISPKKDALACDGASVMFCLFGS